MKLWTIQSQERWNKLQQEGVLYSLDFDREYIFEPAYEFMAAELQRRVGPPPLEGLCYPMWAWQRWAGKQRAMPDLRSRGHVERGQSAVRLEIDVPAQDTLLSDFMLWGLPFSGNILESSKQELDATEAQLFARFGSLDLEKALQEEDWRRRIHKGWRLVFDLNFDNEYFTSTAQEDKCVQAVFWQLRLDQVCRVKPFIGR